eukprot:111363-Pyramimonas_sp.AAC.1
MGRPVPPEGSLPARPPTSTVLAEQQLNEIVRAVQSQVQESRRNFESISLIRRRRSPRMQVSPEMSPPTPLPVRNQTTVYSGC